MCERQELLASDALTLASRHSVTAGESCDGLTIADVCDIAWLWRCDALSAVACPCALELRAVVATSAVPLRRFGVIGAALIGEDGVRNVTMAVDIGSKSWPFDIRLRPWGFRPHIGLLPLSCIAGGDVRPVATNRLESGRFQGFL